MTTQPQEYTAQFWEVVVEIAVGVMILAAMAAWTFQQVKKVAKGEEIPRPI